MGTYMSAHISWSQLCSWCTWFTWQSGELHSERRFSIGSAASVKSSSNESGWVRPSARCTVGLSVLALSDLASKPARVFTSTSLDLAHSCLSYDSDWFRLDVHSVYHLFSSDRESLHLTAESLHHDSAWMCRSNLLQSQPCESCNMSSDACCACRCQGGYLCCRIGHRSPPLCLYVSLFHSFFSFFLSFNLSISLFLSPDSLSPSPFSLLCTDTLVESPHYALRWPCIAFYIWHKAVNDTEKREHMKRKKKVHTQKGASWFASLQMRASKSRHQSSVSLFVFSECFLVIGVYRVRQKACYNNYTLCSTAYHLAQKTGACVSTRAGQNCFT